MTITSETPILPPRVTSNVSDRTVPSEPQVYTVHDPSAEGTWIKPGRYEASRADPGHTAIVIDNGRFYTYHSFQF